MVSRADRAARRVGGYQGRRPRFSPFTEAHFAKPYDERMRQHMTAAATALACGVHHRSRPARAAPQNELLYRHGINFNDIPHWQRRGTGLHWRDYQKTGSDPRTGIQATATRRTLPINDQLPVKDEHRALVMQILTIQTPALPGRPLHDATSVGAATAP